MCKQGTSDIDIDKKTHLNMHGYHMLQQILCENIDVLGKHPLTCMGNICIDTYCVHHVGALCKLETGTEKARQRKTNVATSPSCSCEHTV